MAIPVGTASINIKPSFEGFSKTVSKEIRGAFPEISKEAGSFGKAVADGFSQGSSDIVKAAQDISAKVAKAKEAQKAASDKASAAADKEADAVGKLRVAQEKLKEVQENGKAKASDLAQAQERVASETRKVESAAKNTKDAQDRLTKTTDELTKAEEELKTATDKANKELEDSKASADKGKKGIQQLGDQAEKAQGKLGRFGDFLKGAFAGAIAAVSFQSIVSGMKEVMDLAGEAEQSVGAVDAVFKGGADQVHQNAKGAVLEVGLSQKDYNNLATQFGTQLKNAGVPLEKIPSEVDRLIRQAADFSALHGGTTQEAADAMASAFRGEFDPIERYGISMRAEAIDAQAASMGYSKEDKSFGQDAKVAASMQLMNVQGADAKGAYQSEDGTYAQQMQEFQAGLENLKAELGEEFLTVASDIVTFLTEKMLPAFSDVKDKVKEFSDGVKKFGEENKGWLEPLSFVIGGIAGAFAVWAAAMGAWSAATAIATGVQWLFNAAMKANPMMLVITLIGALIGLFIYLWQTNEEFRNKVTEIWNGITSFFQTVWTEYLQPFFQAIGDFIMNTLVPAFMDFWQNTIIPVWNGIVEAVSNAWNNFLKPTLDKIWTFIRDTLIPAFVDFWQNTIVPVWSGIVDTISRAWNEFLKPTLDKIWTFIRDTLIPAFMGFWQNTIVPVWEGIKLAIAIAITIIIATFKIVWAFIRDVLAPIFKWLYETIIVPVWEGIKRAIGVAWDIIKTIFDAIVWVINNILAPIFKWLYENVIVPVWEGIKRAIDVAWSIIKSIFEAIKWVLENILAPAFRWIYENIIIPVWEGIKRAIDVAWGIIKGIFNSIKWVLENVLAPAFKWIYENIIKPVWDGIKSTIKNVWENGIKPILDKFGSFVKETLPEMIRRGADVIGKIWEGTKKLFATPINWVIDNVINKGIVDTFNGVAEKLGIGLRLGRAGLIATGQATDSYGNRAGSGGRGTNGMFATGGYTGPGTKYQPAGVVHAGEYVLRKEATRALMGTVGLSGLDHMNKTGRFPGYASGGFVGPLLDLAGGIGGKIRQQFPNGAMLVDMLIGMGKKLVDGGVELAKKKVAELFSAGSGSAGGGAPGKSGPTAPGVLREIAATALRREGIFSEANLASLMRRMWQESNYQAGVVNNWDSNAQRGQASRGLMQVIPSTFAAFRDPSLSSNIFDPLSNIVASIRYTKARYGNVRTGWDRPGGYSSGGLVPAKYDRGGWLEPGIQSVVNRTRKPEPILTAGQWQDIKTVAQQRMNAGGDHYEILVPQIAATGDDVAEAIQFHTRRNKRR